MLNLKKTAVAVLALGSSAVFAGTMGPVCAPGNVTVPCEATAWDFGAQALYLQQSFDSSDLMVGNNDYSYNHSNDDRWGWGFQIEGSYHFNTGNDATLNWYHISKSHTRTVSYTAAVNTPVTDRLATGTYRVSLKPQWDAVNLEFGQHVDFSQFTKVRFHAGAEYARIKTAHSFRLTSASTWTNINETYNGFGPRAGADMFYDFGNGFAVYGKAATSLLAGTNKYYNSFATTAAVKGRSRTVIVPEFDAKLGAKYTYAMASGDLTLDAGYMWVDYLNAKTRAFGTNDFGLDGVYFGLKWVGNVA